MSCTRWTPSGCHSPTTSQLRDKVGVVGRSRPGITVWQATADLMQVQSRVPDVRSHKGQLTRVTALRQHYLGDYRTVARMLLAAVALLCGTRLMSSFLAGVNPHEPRVHAAVVLHLAAAALAAN